MNRLVNALNRHYPHTLFTHTVTIAILGSKEIKRDD